MDEARAAHHFDFCHDSDFPLWRMLSELTQGTKINQALRDSYHGLLTETRDRIQDFRRKPCEGYRPSIGRLSGARTCRQMLGNRSPVYRTTCTLRMQWCTARSDVDITIRLRIFKRAFLQTAGFFSPTRTFGRISPSATLLFAHAESFGDSWVAHGRHDLHVHPRLKGAVAQGLFKLLHKQHLAGHDVGVAIDHYKVVTRGRSPSFIALSRWFGSPFRPGRWDDRTDVGHTVYVRENDIGAGPPNKAGLATEFWRTFQHPLKTFEAAELPARSVVDESSLSEVVCRYVHAIRDVRSGTFIHLDGALHIYGIHAYHARCDALLRRGDRIWASRKVKLFRVDAEPSSGIDDADWQSMIESNT